MKNEDYFKTWSHNMAYVLGFIMADGSVRVTHNYSLSIGLNIKDIEILEFIRNQIFPECKFDYRTKICKNSISRQVRLRIFSKKIVLDLINLNVIPRKTGKEKLPEIPEEYFSDYLRGYFDGDGCIHSRCRNIKAWEHTISLVCASKEFLTELQNKLYINIGSIINDSSHKNPFYRWRFSKRDNVIKFRDYIYKNPGFSLKRKKDKLDLVKPLEIKI